MPSTKTRLDFLADSDLAARLNARVEDRGTTKTEILVQALKCFLDRGTAENEFTQLTAKRFDMLSRELGAVRNELEAVRRDFATVQNDAEFVREALVLFVNVSITANIYMPVPQGDDLTTARTRFERFMKEVNYKIAMKKSPAVSAEKKGNA